MTTSTYRLDAGEIKRRVRIENVISQTEPLRQPAHPETQEWVGLNHDSLRVNPQKQAFFWHSRGLFGDVFDWYVQVLSKPFGEALVELAQGVLPAASLPVIAQPRKAKVEISNRLVDRLHAALLRNPEAIRWCEERGLDELDILRFRLGFIHLKDVGPATILPVFSSGQIATIRYRAWHPRSKAEKYRPLFAGYNAHLINGDELNVIGPEVTIVEGEFKTYHLVKRNYPAVGLMGAMTCKAEWLPKFASKRRVNVALDPDQIPTSLSWVKRLAEMHDNVRIVTLPMKPDDLLMRDGGQDAFDACVRQARKFTVQKQTGNDKR